MRAHPTYNLTSEVGYAVSGCNPGGILVGQIALVVSDGGTRAQLAAALGGTITVDSYTLTSSGSELNGTATCGAPWVNGP